MKFRYAGIVQFVCLVGLAGGLYAWKSYADKEGDQLAQLEAKISEDRLAIRMLEAEIAYFSQPSRIEKAAAEMGLASPVAGQIISVSELEAVAPVAQPAGAAKPTQLTQIPTIVGAR